MMIFLVPVSVLKETTLDLNTLVCFKDVLFLLLAIDSVEAEGGGG